MTARSIKNDRIDIGNRLSTVYYDEISESYDLFIRERFDNLEVVSEYSRRKNVDSSRNRRELKCIENALYDIKRGKKILDIPCGTGRLLSMLEKKEFRITAADYSKHMTEKTTIIYLSENGLKNLPEHIRVNQQDIMQTTYDNREFDVVICNRLFHHYPTPELRRKALKELARISKGILIISFFSNFALSALIFHLKNYIKGRKPLDRVPIWLNTFKKDLRACNLKCTGIYPVRYGISPQTYLRIEKI